LYALVELRDVDHHALVRAVADEFLLVARFDAKAHRPTLHPHHLGARGDAHADRRGRDVAHVQHGAQALVARRQQALDRVERRRFEQVDHHRRGEHVHTATAHARRGVFLDDEQRGTALQARPNRIHVQAMIAACIRAS